MNEFFRRSTAEKAWNYLWPHIKRMTGDMAADYADRVRKQAL